MSGGKRLAGSKTAKKPDLSQFSKWMIADIRPLLWVVTVGGLLLAAYCIRVGYTGSLPWISAMVGLPWTAHGVVCSFYLNMAKSVTPKVESHLKKPKQTASRKPNP